MSANDFHNGLKFQKRTSTTIILLHKWTTTRQAHYEIVSSASARALRVFNRDRWHTRVYSIVIRHNKYLYGVIKMTQNYSDYFIYCCRTVRTSRMYVSIIIKKMLCLLSNENAYKKFWSIRWLLSDAKTLLKNIKTTRKCNTIGEVMNLIYKIFKTRTVTFEDQDRR